MYQMRPKFIKFFVPKNRKKEPTVRFEFKEILQTCKNDQKCTFPNNYNNPLSLFILNYEVDKRIEVLIENRKFTFKKSFFLCKYDDFYY